MKISNKVFTDESITIDTCVFLMRNIDNGVHMLNCLFISGDSAVDEYLHKQSGYYQWCKRKVCNK